MSDHAAIIAALIQAGHKTIRIEIVITVQDQTPAIDEYPYKAICGRCNWSWNYKHKSSANRALRSHAQHCTGSGSGSRYVQNGSKIPSG